ncbi:hypothetical protein EHQ81_17275 [Leptospira selangorensis]|uniref:Uncharacterized protein n=1 Tax=Leptospira selangorensis TaxID=2484982 RepID=A0A5F2C1E3_9LEPT|nr:hypothetical protein [Leptospira selangorensis]TGM11421.1 hypothetical protein EHQ81_17275 [Leptospira selangorensis]TGM21070.1 hypothetical protein EHQ82_08660 [Leptospira selangorensis]
MKLKSLTLFLISGISLFAWESKDKTETIVNWRTGEIIKTVEVKLPKIAFHPDDPDYNKIGTAKNITEARNIAKETAKEEIKKYLYRSMENLKLDSNLLLREKIAQDESFREIFQEIYEKEPIEIHNQFKGNHLIATGVLSLKGKKGILSHITLPYSSENFPEAHPIHNPADSYTGLIVDARHLDVVPALFSEIRDEDGIGIYSPLFVKKSSIVNYGYIRYFSKVQDAMKEEVAGYKPLLTTALGVSGKLGADLVISNEDAEKVLASPKSREALLKGRVIVILGTPKK